MKGHETVSLHTPPMHQVTLLYPHSAVTAPQACEDTGSETVLRQVNVLLSNSTEKSNISLSRRLLF